jgi:nitrite reductase/ring-hydroxylating ferredoxin subunit
VGVTEKVLNGIERAEVLDSWAEKASAVWSKLLAPPKVRDLLSGRQLGHPLHPAAVLIPAGSLLSATSLDALHDPALEPAARRLVGLGLLASVPTVLAGWSDWLDTEQAERRVGLVHATSNALGLAAYGVSWWQRRGGNSGRLAGYAGALALGAGGWLGGHLAYAQGVGVDTTAFQSGPTKWTAAGTADDITEELSQVDVDGVAILLTRVDGRIVALEDRCTHRGAPLSDGERVGGCVVCPWHASRFDLTTGSVEQGPASRPQPSYQVRERAGQVEIRRAEHRALRTNPVTVSS